MGSRRAAAYRIQARAPTRSPQGGRARQNAAKNPADLHAGRFARRAQARVGAEGKARGRGERVPTAKRVGKRVPPAAANSGEDSRPLRRPRPAASAAGPWPKRGRPSPERREAERGSSTAARSAAPWGTGQGRPRSGRARGRPKGGLRRARRRGARRAGLWGEAGAGGKQPAQWGLEQGGRKGESVAAAEGETTQNSFFGCPVSSTTLDSAFFRPSFSKGRQTPRTDAAGGFPYCSPFAMTTFSRRTDRGRRLRRWFGKGVQRRRDERGRRELSGWGTRICGTDRRKRCAGVPAGSGGRRVRQGRRAERLGRISGPTVPKGGASLRASLAAVGSGQAAPLPALWRSFFARGQERFDPVRVKFRLFPGIALPAFPSSGKVNI